MLIRRSLVAAAVAVGTWGTVFGAAAQTILKAADVHPAGYPNVVAIENLGKKLEAATNGRYKLQMFPSGVLGGEKEMVEQTQVGAIQIARISLGVLGPIVPDVNVFNMPFVFRNEGHMRMVIDGPIGDELLKKITDSPAKLVALGWMDSGSRSLYSKTPVRKMDDLKGLKIRVMGNPLFRDMMNAMGGNAISMGHPEVRGALETGVVDGAENNPPTLFTSGQYSAGIKYYTQTQHLIIPEIFVMSRITWDKMAPPDQALVRKFSREAQMEQRAMWDKSVADYSAKLKAAGIEWIEMDTKPFYDATAPVRAKYGADYADLIKRINDVK